MVMKMACACLMFLCFTVLPLRAGPGPSADDIVSKMQSQLNLTSDQVSAVTPIIEKYTSQFEELRQSMEDGTADRDSVRDQMKQLRQSESQELSQVLSSDQMAQWKQMQHKHKHGSGGESSGGDNGGGSGDNPPSQ